VLNAACGTFERACGSVNSADDSGLRFFTMGLSKLLKFMS
jgi:hypothetical protein